MGVTKVTDILRSRPKILPEAQASRFHKGELG